jgi:hypothetical protein
MAIRSGFQSSRIMLNNIPNTQPSGLWSGNNTPITYLSPGVYFCNYNVSYLVNGTGPITNTQAYISLGASVSGGGQIVAATPQTGQLGLVGTNSMRQTISNSFVVTSPNTPMYVYLNCVLTGATWGTTNASEVYLNIVSFTKISSL